MPEKKDNGIKLELSRDKTTGKLNIAVRFNSKASNIIVENGNYTWIPTFEEKELIDEAFDLISSEKMPKSTTSDEKTMEIKKPIETEERAEIEKSIETEKDASIELKDKIETLTEKNKLKKDDELETKVDIKSKSEEDETEKEKGDIVEVGDDSIESAINKHIKKDEPLKEADEHTIIDKVLSQKKKGRWKKI
jgi:hypothetical protein